MPASYVFGSKLYTQFLLFFVFVLLPVADMFTGWLILSGMLSEGAVGSPSQFFRALILIFLLFKLLVLRDVRWVLLPVLIFFLEAAVAIGHEKTNGLLNGFMFASRVLYLVALAYALKAIIEEGGRRLLYKWVCIGGLVISGSLLLAFLTSTGFSTYGWGFGTKGYFASGNGLGLHLGILALVLIYIYYDSLRPSGISAISVFVGLFAIFLIGSKTAGILGIMALICFFGFRHPFLVLASALILFSIIVYRFSAIIQSLFEVIWSRFNVAPDFLTFITSGRNSYVENAFSTYIGSDPNPLTVLLGSGYFCSFRPCHGNLFFDTLESDFFDFFFMYGVVGLAIYLGFFIFFAIRIYHSRGFLLFLAWALLFLHSAFAGHVMQNGMNLTLVALLLSFSFSGTDSAKSKKGAEF